MICDAVRDVSKEEFENMAGSLPLPRLVRSLLKVMAAGPMIAQSPSMAEVRAWLEGLPISDIDARFVEGIPGMIAVARKKRMDG